VLDNFSCSGCYLRLARRIVKGEKVMLITQISGAIIVLRGVVQRIRLRKDGTYGIGVTTEQHQIFSLRKFQC
jgi:hypothetical protein